MRQYSMKPCHTQLWVLRTSRLLSSSELMVTLVASAIPGRRMDSLSHSLLTAVAVSYSSLFSFEVGMTYETSFFKNDYLGSSDKRSACLMSPCKRPSATIATYQQTVRLFVLLHRAYSSLLEIMTPSQNPE